MFRTSVFSESLTAYQLLFIDFQLSLKRTNTLELEDVQEDVGDDIDMGKNNIHLRHLVHVCSYHLTVSEPAKTVLTSYGLLVLDFRC